MEYVWGVGGVLVAFVLVTIDTNTAGERELRHKEQSGQNRVVDSAGNTQILFNLGPILLISTPCKPSPLAPISEEENAKLNEDANGNAR